MPITRCQPGTAGLPQWMQQRTFRWPVQLETVEVLPSQSSDLP